MSSFNSNNKNNLTKNQYYIPIWNKKNDPDQISCSKAMKFYMSCSMKTLFSSKSENYNNIINDCKKALKEVILCMKLKNTLKYEDKKKILEKEYPWLCDSTYGMRFRHIWEFRSRPPEFFDIKKITEKEYEIMRESSHSFFKNGFFGYIYFKFFSEKVFKDLEMTSEEYYKNYFSDLKKKPKNKSERTEKSTLNFIMSITNQKEPKSNIKGIKNQYKQEDLEPVFKDIVANSGDEEQNKIRNNDIKKSFNMLFGDKTKDIQSKMFNLIIKPSEINENNKSKKENKKTENINNNKNDSLITMIEKNSRNIYEKLMKQNKIKDYFDKNTKKYEKNEFKIDLFAENDEKDN